MKPGGVLPPNALFARHWERQGLHCEPYLPAGASPMQAPPLVSSRGKVINPRASKSKELREWARDVGGGFYSRYVVIHPPGRVQGGIAVLAGDDVSAKSVQRHAETLRHLLLEAMVNSSTLAALSQVGVRVLLAGRRASSWTRHPELHRNFISGLGGGAPWFPSMGIHVTEKANLLAEELFHTIQYVAMTPREVCAYHHAYGHAVASKLYTTDYSGPEIDGEPVPTVQADEYFAMALQRWLGSHDGGRDEYRVPGNNRKGTGREHLRRMDPRGFCLVSRVLRSDDGWSPDPESKPWRRYPNQAMKRAEVETFCRPILSQLEEGCPSVGTTWPPAAPEPRAWPPKD